MVEVGLWLVVESRVGIATKELGTDNNVFELAKPVPEGLYMRAATANLHVTDLDTWVASSSCILGQVWLASQKDSAGLE